MSAKFRKKSTQNAKNKPKKSGKHVPKKAKADNSKSPASRVPDGQIHHDFMTTKALYVLIDLPLDPEEFVTLDHGTQHWTNLSTKKASAINNFPSDWSGGTALVFYLNFEPVADGGKFTLKLKRGDSVAELFADIEAKNLFFGTDPRVGTIPALDAEEIHGERREPVYEAIGSLPATDDADLKWPDQPYAALMEIGPQKQ